MNLRPVRRPIVTPIPAGLKSAIEASIDVYPKGRLGSIVRDTGRPLAIKYISAKWAKDYVSGTRPFRVSTTPGFTWGTGTYVTPLVYPISSAIFGRIGLVASFDPSGWRVFDATDVQKQRLYMDWVGAQPLYGPLVLTMHSSLANQYLRDLFKTTFQIDCILFHPDQFNVLYTDVTRDVWMTVIDWRSNGEIQRDSSARFADVRFTVIVEEEFSPDEHDIERTTLIGPITPPQPHATIMSQIINAYDNSQHVYIEV